MYHVRRGQRKGSQYMVAMPSELVRKMGLTPGTYFGIMQWDEDTIILYRQRGEVIIHPEEPHRI